jgi:hypothetical protein
MLIDLTRKKLRRKEMNLMEDLPRGIYGLEKSSGSGPPTHPPSHRGITQDSGIIRLSFPSRLRGSGGFQPPSFIQPFDYLLLKKQKSLVLSIGKMPGELDHKIWSALQIIVRLMYHVGCLF